MKKREYHRFLFLASCQVCIILILYLILQKTVPFYESGNYLQTPGLLVELLSLIIVFFVFLTLTNNFFFSFLISNLLYLLFVAASLIKTQYLNVPLVFYDLFQINDLLLNLDSVDIAALIVFIVVFLVILITICFAVLKGKNNNYRMSSGLVLIGFTTILLLTTDDVKSFFSSNKIKYKWNSNVYLKTQTNGLLTFFVQSIYFSSKLTKPPQYSLIKANKFLNESRSIGQLPINTSDTTPENVIVLMIESFQNIKKLPWKTNKEVTPTYNRLEREGFSGYLIAPVFGGKSINSEFELLTGFSNIFTPQGSIPYKDFIHHGVPSLAKQFKNQGYTTNAIQVVKMKGYGYGSIYEHLGFDQKFSLSRFEENIDLDPTKRFGSSKAIAKKINELINKQNKSFIFAFPNSSHSPWKMEDYPDNKLNLIDNDINQDMAEEVLAFYNSMVHVDELFKYLTEQLNENEKTIILIVGDHQPALKIKRDSKIRHASTKSKLDKHLVPFLFWANYDIKFPSETKNFTSMNLIGLKLMELANIRPQGFFAFLSSIKEQYQAFSFVLVDNDEIIDIKNRRDSDAVKKYQFIQYKYLSNNEE